MKMPILGTKGTSYICSYFEWTYSFGEIRKISQSFNFVSEFVSGMSTWLGAHSNLPQGAWQVEDMRWQLDYLPFDCKFNS